MSILNEKGRANRNTTLTFFLFGLMPFILGTIWNFDIFFLNGNVSAIYPYAIIEFWGLSFSLFTLIIRRKIEKWIKNKENDE